MKKIIGFAEKFYTFWSHERVISYVTDAYGNHHPSMVTDKYYYIKNISTDLDKVRLLHPGVEIDESLRGQVRSFERSQVIEKPSDIFWFGKYTGKKVDEIMISDFQYCLWVVKNNSNTISTYIQNHPIYVEYLTKLNQEKEQLINSVPILKAGDVAEIEFTTNGYNADETYSECWANAYHQGVNIAVLCPGVKRVNRMYPYLMPVINSKAQRTKNKTIKVTVTEIVQDTDIKHNEVYQWIKVK